MYCGAKPFSPLQAKQKNLEDNAVLYGEPVDFTEHMLLCCQSIQLWTPSELQRSALSPAYPAAPGETEEQRAAKVQSWDDQGLDSRLCWRGVKDVSNSTYVVEMRKGCHTGKYNGRTVPFYSPPLLPAWQRDYIYSLPPANTTPSSFFSARKDIAVSILPQHEHTVCGCFPDSQSSLGPTLYLLATTHGDDTWRRHLTAAAQAKCRRVFAVLPPFSAAYFRL